MSKINLKIKAVSLAVASLLGLSFIARSAVSAMESSGSSPISLGELKAQLSDLWGKFWVARSNVRDTLDVAEVDVDVNALNVTEIFNVIIKNAALNATKNAAWNALTAAWVAVEAAAGTAAVSTAQGIAWNASNAAGVDSDSAEAAVAFVGAWGKDVAAYNLIKDNDYKYFENLRRVLKEQTQKLNEATAKVIANAS